MNAQELRIGNLLNFDDLNGHISIEKIISICKEYEVYWCVTENFEGELLSAFQPIPLTKEWLLKFGFEKRGIRFNKNGLLLWLDMGRFVFALFESDSKIERNTLLISVHQLQNLYFALTGQELTLTNL